MSRTVRRQDGSAVVTAVMLMAIMLMVGLALLTVVDTQAGQTRKERVGDSAFNLAEAALNGQAFLLARSWPEAATHTRSGVNLQCGADAQTYQGTLATPATTTSATDQLQALLAKTFTSSDYGSGAAWRVSVCEDPGRTDWDNSLLTARAYDSAAAASTTATPRRLWVRAQATVRGQTKAVAALVQANQVSPLPSRYAVVAGGMSTDVGTITNGPVLNGLAGGLLGQRKLYAKDPADPQSGRLGIRCALTSSLDCVTGSLFATVSQTTLSNLLLANDTVRFRSDTALDDDTVAALRRQAQSQGTYRETVAAGTDCLPAGAAGKVVFVENVGGGDDWCRIAATSSARALVVANGRVRVVGASSSPGITFTGVIHALFRQRERSPAPSKEAVVRISDWAKVRGAVFVDGQGKLAVIPPPFDTNALINSLPLCNGLISLVCNTLLGSLRLLGLDALINDLVGRVGVTAVVDSLLGQLSGWGPAVQEDQAVVRAVKVYGSSGVVSGTFRELPAT